MKNFITQCLNVNPQNRPTIDETWKHRLLGGSLEYKVKKNDVWQVKILQQKLNFLVSLFIARNASLELPSDTSASSRDLNPVYIEPKVVASKQEMEQNDVKDDYNLPDTSANKKSETNKIKMINVNEVFDQSKIVSTDKEELCEMHWNINEISDQSKTVADKDRKSSDKKVIDASEVSGQSNIASDEDTILN